MKEAVIAAFAAMILSVIGLLMICGSLVVLIKMVSLI